MLQLETAERFFMIIMSALISAIGVYVVNRP